MRVVLLAGATLALLGCRDLVGVSELPPGDLVSLEIVLAGGGAGQVSLRVQGSQRSSACPPDCRVLVPQGGLVDLVPSTHDGAGAFFAGWDASCPPAKHDCTLEMAAARRVEARFLPIAHNLIFVTSERISAARGGLAPYDALCNRLASAAGINDASATAYIAWLSAAAQPAAERLGTARGFVRLDGRPVAADLTRPELGFWYPVGLDEWGQASEAEVVMTATTGGGRANASCADFTSADAALAADGGDPFGGPALWTSGLPAGCALEHPIYCVMRTRQAALAPSSSPGKLVFVSPPDFVSGGGAAAADALCERARPASHGTAIFKALLATADVPAARWLTAAALYVRPDGIAVGTGAALLDGLPESGIWQTGDGAYVLDSERVATGALDDAARLDDAPTAAATCGGWLLPDGNQRAGTVQRLRQWWSAYKHGCRDASRVYCVQQ